MKPHVFLLALTLITISCNQEQNPESTSLNSVNSNELSAEAIKLASPITYEVIIKNFDTSDVWKAECLENLEREKLMNTIFQQVYNGELIALNYFNDDTIPPVELKNMEEELSTLKDDIAKLQFTENWYYDSIAHKLHKQISELTFGYPKLSPDSVLVYKPVFKIKFD